MTHIYVCKLTIIGSDNGLSPERRQAIIWTNAGILLIWTIGNKLQWNFDRNSKISLKKRHLKMSSAKWRLFCLGLNVLSYRNDNQPTWTASHHRQITDRHRPGCLQWYRLIHCIPTVSSWILLYIQTHQMIATWHGTVIRAPSTDSSDGDIRKSEGGDPLMTPAVFVSFCDIYEFFLTKIGWLPETHSINKE